MTPADPGRREPPIGDGLLCSGGLWIIDTSRDCPICGVGKSGPCGRDLDDVVSRALGEAKIVRS